MENIWITYDLLMTVYKYKNLQMSHKKNSMIRIGKKKNLNIVLKMNRNITKVMSTATFWKDKKRWRTGRDPRIELLRTGEIREWTW